jgi:hypothetical protein
MELRCILVQVELLSFSALLACVFFYMPLKALDGRLYHAGGRLRRMPIFYRDGVWQVIRDPNGIANVYHPHIAMRFCIYPGSGFVYGFKRATCWGVYA